MQKIRLIVVIVIFSVGMVGQGDAQKRDRNAGILAQWKQQSALLNSLLDTAADCVDRTPKGEAVQCDVYYAQVNQTSLDVLLSPVLASKLKAKLTATDIEDLKSTISINLVNAYYYGKGKQ
ncbi:MAG TPA: hypothetical protein VFV58_34685 [Blastocatellia bacterium]|nr:hypothetical protein [Blastocatellia bacterium]